ncbi:hypothetical protein [Streptomyces adelaidensis]|uniref:hypothetical protein n=1 Tax=Streptomyces adelaidensis TaxID=2796465 RepID=UPI0019070B28|nr:hypothetical protein [Streptomyces adelaidensis]
MWTRWVWVGVVAVTVVGVVAALLLGGGDDESAPRAVSADEARRMALARFRTYEASPSEPAAGRHRR